MADMLGKLRPRRTVLIRTTKKADLPEAALYVEWLGGEMSRKVLDAEHKEHVVTDQILLSNYKIAGGPEAEKLIATHWKKDQPKKQAPVRNA
ncbi:MAG: hypothetical protein HY903_20075 [Deltaproteobacteria bacterium]|nr:hypothetical protein [Deltaproteobacteria bacterium]